MPRGSVPAWPCCRDIVVASREGEDRRPARERRPGGRRRRRVIWPQLVGYAKARKYLFTGELLPAAEAERIGLITEVVPQAELDAAVDGLAQRIAAGATKSIRWTKITTNLPLKQLFHSYFDAGIAYECLSNRSADHREAVAAFRERRKPQFTGN